MAQLALRQVLCCGLCVPVDVVNLAALVPGCRGQLDITHTFMESFNVGRGFVLVAGYYVARLTTSPSKCPMNKPRKDIVLGSCVPSVAQVIDFSPPRLLEAFLPECIKWAYGSSSSTPHNL